MQGVCSQELLPLLSLLCRTCCTCSTGCLFQPCSSSLHLQDALFTSLTCSSFKNQIYQQNTSTCCGGFQQECFAGLVLTRQFSAQFITKGRWHRAPSPFPASGLCSQHHWDGDPLHLGFPLASRAGGGPQQGNDLPGSTVSSVPQRAWIGSCLGSWMLCSRNHQRVLLHSTHTAGLR